MRFVFSVVFLALAGCPSARQAQEAEDDEDRGDIGVLVSMDASVSVDPAYVIGTLDGASVLASVTSVFTNRAPDIAVRMDHVGGDRVLDHDFIDHTPHIDLETAGIAAWFPNVGGGEGDTETYTEKLYLDCMDVGVGQYQFSVVDKASLEEPLGGSAGLAQATLQVECFESGDTAPIAPEQALFSVNPEGGSDPIETLSVTADGVVKVGSTPLMGMSGPNAEIAGTGSAQRALSPGYLVYGSGTFSNRLTLYPLLPGGSIGAPTEGSPFDIDIDTYDMVGHPSEDIVYITSGQSGLLQAVSIAGGVAEPAQDPIALCNDWAGDIAYDGGLLFAHCGSKVHVFDDEGDGALTKVNVIDADGGFSVANSMLLTESWPDDVRAHEVHADGSTTELSGPHGMSSRTLLSADGACACGGTFSTGEFLCWAIGTDGSVTESHRMDMSILTHEFSHEGGFVAAIDFEDYRFRAWEVDADCGLIELPGSGEPISDYVYSLGSGPLVSE